MATQAADKLVCAGVFHDADQAGRVVGELSQHGFTDDQITVVCSDREIEKRFRPFEHQEPAGYYSPAALITGGLVGGFLGAVIPLIAAIVTGEYLFLLGTGMLAALAGGVFGAFFGEMMTRGVEKELSNFYDQELQPGDILVAAEDHGPRAAETLEEAGHIFEHAGARPLKLAGG